MIFLKNQDESLPTQSDLFEYGDDYAINKANFVAFYL